MNASNVISPNLSMPVSVNSYMRYFFRGNWLFFVHITEYIAMLLQYGVFFTNEYHRMGMTGDWAWYSKSAFSCLDRIYMGTGSLSFVGSYSGFNTVYVFKEIACFVLTSTFVYFVGLFFIRTSIGKWLNSLQWKLCWNQIHFIYLTAA